MKIGYFVWEYPPRIVGGLGTYAQNMAPMLVAKGHDVTLFTINSGDLVTSEVIIIGRSDGGKIGKEGHRRLKESRNN